MELNNLCLIKAERLPTSENSRS